MLYVVLLNVSLCIGIGLFWNQKCTVPSCLLNMSVGDLGGLVLAKT